MSDRNHPIWSFLRFLVLMGAVTFVLWQNASNFDATEWKAIAEIAVAVLLGRGGVALAGKLKGGANGRTDQDHSA